MADDISLPALVRLINLINKDNPGANVTPDQVDVSEPTVVSAYSRNTSVTLTAREGSGVSGARTLYYNRLNIGTYLSVYDGEVAVFDPQTTLDLLEPIFQQYGVRLTEDDVVSNPIVGLTEGVPNPGGVSHQLVAKDTSYGWLGTVNLTVVDPILYLTEVLGVNSSFGFVYPNESPAYARGDITAWSGAHFYQLVNTVNEPRYNLNNTNTTLGVPVEIEPDVDGNNTTILITAVEGQGFAGQQTITYKRLDIAQAYPDGFDMGGQTNGIADTHALLPLLNTEFGVKLRTDEVVNQTISSTATTTTIVIANTSQQWQPGTVLSVSLPDIPLGNLLTALNISGFVLPAQSPEYAVVDPTVDSFDQLFQLIKTANAAPSLTLDMVDFSSPTSITPDGAGRNTQVTLTATVDSEYFGSVDIRYRRVDIGLMYPDAFVPTTSLDAVTTVADVIAILNAEYGLALRVDEFVAGPLNSVETPFVLTVSANSEVWLPGSTISVGIAQDLNGSVLTHDDGSLQQLDDGNVLGYDVPSDAPGFVPDGFLTDGGSQVNFDGGAPFQLD